LISIYRFALTYWQEHLEGSDLTDKDDVYMYNYLPAIFAIIINWM